jgi:mannose-6-phosphate isomerase-like protein (cupin superfamily)
LGAIIVDSKKVKEEQIWGPSVPFFDKKMFRGKEFAATYRRLKPARFDSMKEHKVHDHGDSWEIAFFLKGRIKEYFEGIGTKEIGPGDLLIVEPHTTHGLVEVLEDNEQVVFYVPTPKSGRY